jgi:hypothetical protein
MKRTLTDHIVAGDSANHQLTIEVTDEPGQGGACHLYEITGFNAQNNPAALAYALPFHAMTREFVLFQNGPIKEFGVNGVTHEVLLAILIDRLRSFQTGPYRSDDNEAALDGLEMALDALQDRTRKRIARGVEGTHAK